MRKIITLTCLMILSTATLLYSSWQGPTEILSGGWGTVDTNFGLESGDTSDRFPGLAAILFDGRIVISDQVNEREVVYNKDGSLFKVVPWYIIKDGTKIVNPDYRFSKYWNVQGYTPEGNVWYKIDSYFLKSPTGQLIKTSTTKPLELGSASSRRIGSGQYQTIVKYPDITYQFTAAQPTGKYYRDLNSNLYVFEQSTQTIAEGTADEEDLIVITYKVYKYNACSKKAGVLDLLPLQTQDLSTDAWDEYGEPLVAANGDIYTWRRNDTNYSIVKWTWQDDPNTPTGPDAPAGLTIAASTTGLYLTWSASPQDPGCVIGYEISRSTTSGGTFSVLTTVDKGVLNYNDTTADAGTTYYYKLRAKAGNDFSVYTAAASGTR